MTVMLRITFAFLIMLAGISARSHAEAAEDSSIQKAIENYCVSVSDLAMESRNARQTSALKQLQVKVEEQLVILEKRKDELAELIKERNELRTLADKEIVEIYSSVDAEAAAAQMERLDLRLASSVLRQLKPRQASAILDVMKPELAAQLVRLISTSTMDEKSTR